MNCKGFRDRIFLFQADELPEPERLDCQRHLDACASCAALLRWEDVALETLRAGLRRTPAPAGLDARVRAALRAEAAGPRRAPGYRTGWIAVTAAAAALALLLVAPRILSRGGRDGEGSAFVTARVVTVVDLDCDRAGKTIEQQRRCRHPNHVNALKLADGSYWTMDPGPAEFRYLLLDPGERGRTLRVAGRLAPETGVIRLDSIERFDARFRRPWTDPGALPAVASVLP